MALFTKESLELLRSRIDLVEALSPYLQLKRQGAVYKALCPFHEEKSPSFMVKAHDSHYHCFGCGAHGDAIQFLMTHLRMGFSESVELLAEKFQVPLETGDKSDSSAMPRAMLREALAAATRFYHLYLLHTIEGHEALEYLYQRGLDLSFLRTFQIGLAPRDSDLFFAAMQEQKISPEALREAGFFAQSGRLLFFDRVTIPIQDALGSVIGFSARKFRPNASGPKYLNTPETILFKKSKVLFGFHSSRKKIAKERRALIVEGQIDALRLIFAGFDWTVAGQGTAFGEGHVQELLQLGLHEVFLALDGDSAGQEAAVKIGHLFQKEGIDVKVVLLAAGKDPDLILREEGPKAWEVLLGQAVDYLTFLLRHTAQSLNIQTPAGKNEWIQGLVQRIRDWNHPLMVHESLKKLAKMTSTPEELLGIPQAPLPAAYLPYAPKSPLLQIDPDRILEADLLLWLFLMGESQPELIDLARRYLTPEHFRISVARALFVRYLTAQERDLLSLALDPEEQQFLSEMFQKKVNREKAKEYMLATVQKILERSWMAAREEIKRKIGAGGLTDGEMLMLAKEFDELKRHKPNPSF